MKIIAGDRVNISCGWISLFRNFSMFRRIQFVVSTLILNTYLLIYSLKYAFYLGKFWSRVWSVPGPLFHFPLIGKRCAGDKVGNSCFILILLQDKTGFALVGRGMTGVPSTTRYFLFSREFLPHTPLCLFLGSPSPILPHTLTKAPSTPPNFGEPYPWSLHMWWTLKAVIRYKSSLDLGKS